MVLHPPRLGPGAHQEFLGLVHLQEGVVARALPQGDLYYVLHVLAGAAFLFPFLGLTD